MSKNIKSTYGEPKDNYTRRKMFKSIFVFIVCVLLTLICLVPIYILLVNATRASNDIAASPASGWFGSNLVNNWKMLVGDIYQEDGKTLIEGFVKNAKNISKQYGGAFDVLLGYRNSLIIAGSTTILTVFFSAMTAYGLTVYDFKLKGPAYTFIIAVMMVPVQVTSAGFVAFMYSLDLINNFIPLIVPAIAAPAVVFFMKSYMKSSFPLDIVEAARIDGCGEFRTFLTIALPMMKPAIAVQAIFAFVANWNNYYTQNMILKSPKLATIPIMVSKITNFDKNIDHGVKYLCIMLSILPIVIIYFILSKFIIAGVALGGVKE